MKKCCLVLAYFGKMPKYFPLFLKSCEYNPKLNFLVLTDDKMKYPYPKNVNIVYMSFDEMKNKIQSYFDFDISLKNPYKLCDYRPVFGYIFEYMLKDYEYWGYCDNDIIFGDIEKFFIEGYDKAFCLGHLTIFRNTHENNRLFMSENIYKKAFTSSKNVIFDECYNNKQNIHDIFLRHSKKVYEKDFSVNFKILSTKFIKITFQPETREFISDDTESLYVWDNGKIFRYYMKDELVKEEYLYIHLQERKMKYQGNLKNIYKIIPNRFLPLEMEITKDNFPKIKKKAFTLHLLQYHIKWKTRGLKRRLISMSFRTE